MKKSLIIPVLLFFATISGFANTSGTVASVNDKVLRSFENTFPSAEQVNWQEFTDNYTVNFVANGIRSRINYDKEGNFITATRYYSEEHLPVNILCKIRKKYADQTIFGVTEVDSDTSVEYFIKLEDKNNWTTIKSDNNGNTEII